MLVLCILSLAAHAKNIEKTIIYQPQISDFKDSHLKEKFEILSRFGFTGIIIQWSRYGEYNFLVKQPGWYDELFSLAEKYHIKIIMGLYADPKYFSLLDRKKYDIKHYFDILLKENKNSVDEIIKKYGKNEAFWGWYVYDELNDQAWQDEKRRKIVSQYLKSFNNYLIKKSPSKHKFISAYYTNTIKPEEYIALLDNVVPKGWNILIQSAVGAGLIDIHTWDNFYKDCRKSLRHPWVPIIEIFTMKNQKIQGSYQIFLMQKKYTQQAHALFSWRYFFSNTFLLKY